MFNYMISITWFQFHDFNYMISIQYFISNPTGENTLHYFSYGPKYKDASTLLKLPHLPSENSPIYYHEPLIVPKREWVDRSIEGDSSVRVGSTNWSNGCISCLTLLECLVKALWRGVCSQLRGHELKGYCTKFFMWRMSWFYTWGYRITSFYRNLWNSPTFVLTF